MPCLKPAAAAFLFSPTPPVMPPRPVPAEPEGLLPLGLPRYDGEYVGLWLFWPGETSWLTGCVIVAIDTTVLLGTPRVAATVVREESFTLPGYPPPIWPGPGPDWCSATGGSGRVCDIVAPTV